VIVGSGFNSIELTRPILILESGKFPSLIGWDERVTSLAGTYRYKRYAQA
jgi:hypothetical protein